MAEWTEERIDIAFREVNEAIKRVSKLEESFRDSDDGVPKLIIQSALYNLSALRRLITDKNAEKQGLKKRSVDTKSPENGQ